MDPEELELVIEDAESLMKKAITHLETELTKIRAGKANPTMVDGIFVEYYGSPTPIAQVANVAILDARTISIQPWEKNMLQAIEKAILQANIGITPQNDGNQIRLFLPPLTQERRKELFKKASAEGEHSKVAIRNIRRDAIEEIKRMINSFLQRKLSLPEFKTNLDSYNKQNNYWGFTAAKGQMFFNLLTRSSEKDPGSFVSLAKNAINLPESVAGGHASHYEITRKSKHVANM